MLNFILERMRCIKQYIKSVSDVGVDRLLLLADIRHFYDYRIGHFQNRCADKNYLILNVLFGSDAACLNSPLCGSKYRISDIGLLGL